MLIAAFLPTEDEAVRDSEAAVRAGGNSSAQAAWPAREAYQLHQEKPDAEAMCQHHQAQLRGGVL